VIASIIVKGYMSVLEFSSTGEYRDERLYLLKTVERLEGKVDTNVADLVLAKSGLEKFRSDLNEAHGRIRGLHKTKEDLEGRILRMEMKAGWIATAVGVITVSLIEVGKHFLFK
jgi:hypothetical protein